MTATRTARLISGRAGALVHTADDPVLGRIEVVVLDPDADLDVIHRWVTAPGAAFWGLAGHSREELRDLYAYVDELPSHHAFLIRRESEPVVLLQTYEPENDPLGDAYDTLPGDVGIHFLLGARGAPVAGFTTRIGHVIASFVFSRPEVDRIVIEPDVDNDRALARVRLFGFEHGPHVDLPGKTGQLAFLTRQRWETLSAALG
ncbi:GNAT family N-acetyltransferase [Microbacterium allomyrinae]|uniref:Lysine N-acyltransferase MbtK n=1 Tax=Microbacterium allomyrinae TaxID=2830666 RepID=A0A9X1LTG6_9MICO|nr:GNAT family N-acetyltransferase [Microbacterium allomyrinae]MCC2031502.1 acetyltransferase [Microbacterium allomyrinae]